MPSSLSERTSKNRVLLISEANIGRELGFAHQIGAKTGCFAVDKLLSDRLLGCYLPFASAKACYMSDSNNDE